MIWRTSVLERGFSFRRCGDSPAPPIPPRPDEASPAAAPLLHAQVLRHAQSLVIHLSLDLVLRRSAIRFQERSRPRDTPSDRSHDCGILEDRSRKRFASSDLTGHRRRFAAGDSPSPMHLAILQTIDGDSLQEIPLLLCI